MAELVRGLSDLGMTVDLRGRMHETIALLDGRILWHGSPNILSHRDTHESMLRIESPAACQQPSRFVSAPTGRREENAARSLDASENPACPNCSRPTVWNDGRFGIYFKCENANCGGKVDPRRARGAKGNGTDCNRAGRGDRRATTQRATTDTGQPCPQPGCDGRLAERNGKCGRFPGCTNDPRCRYTENLE